MSAASAFAPPSFFLDYPRRRRQRMPSMKGERDLVGIERSLGLRSTRGISRQTNKTAPPIQAILDGIKRISKAHVTSSNTEIRASRALKDEALQLLDDHGPQIWPDPAEERPAWLEQPSTTAFDGKYPRDLYYNRPADREILRNHFHRLVVEKTCNYHDNQLQKSRRVSAKTLNGLRGSPSATPNPREASHYADSEDDGYGPNAWFIDRHDSTPRLMKSEASPPAQDMSPHLSSTNNIKAEQQQHHAKHSPRSSGVDSVQTRTPEEDSRSHSSRDTDYQPSNGARASADPTAATRERRKRRRSDSAETGAERVGPATKRVRGGSHHVSHENAQDDEDDSQGSVESKYQEGGNRLWSAGAFRSNEATGDSLPVKLKVDGQALAQLADDPRRTASPLATTRGTASSAGNRTRSPSLAGSSVHHGEGRTTRGASKLHPNRPDPEVVHVKQYQDAKGKWYEVNFEGRPEWARDERTVTKKAPPPDQSAGNASRRRISFTSSVARSEADGSEAPRDGAMDAAPADDEADMSIKRLHDNCCNVESYNAAPPNGGPPLWGGLSQQQQQPKPDKVLGNEQKGHAHSIASQTLPDIPPSPVDGGDTQHRSRQSPLVNGQTTTLADRGHGTANHSAPSTSAILAGEKSQTSNASPPDTFPHVGAPLLSQGNAQSRPPSMSVGPQIGTPAAISRKASSNGDGSIIEVAAIPRASTVPQNAPSGSAGATPGVRVSATPEVLVAPNVSRREEGAEPTPPLQPNVAVEKPTATASISEGGSLTLASEPAPSTVVIPSEGSPSQQRPRAGSSTTKKRKEKEPDAHTKYNFGVLTSNPPRSKRAYPGFRPINSPDPATPRPTKPLAASILGELAESPIARQILGERKDLNQDQLIFMKTVLMQHPIARFELNEFDSYAEWLAAQQFRPPPPARHHQMQPAPPPPQQQQQQQQHHQFQHHQHPQQMQQPQQQPPHHPQQAQMQQAQQPQQQMQQAQPPATSTTAPPTHNRMPSNGSQMGPPPSTQPAESQTPRPNTAASGEPAEIQWSQFPGPARQSLPHAQHVAGWREYPPMQQAPPKATQPPTVPAAYHGPPNAPHAHAPKTALPAVQTPVPESPGAGGGGDLLADDLDAFIELNWGHEEVEFSDHMILQDFRDCRTAADFFSRIEAQVPPELQRPDKVIREIRVRSQAEMKDKNRLPRMLRNDGSVRAGLRSLGKILKGLGPGVEGELEFVVVWK